MNVVIIDYGLGNLASLSSAVKEAHKCNPVISHAAKDILAADKIILPGVGAFDKAMSNLHNLDLIKIIGSAVNNIPILGAPYLNAVFPRFRPPYVLGS